MTSTLKVNTITTESGSTLTIGGCGKTVTLASGASQSGFGRTGTVDWQTTIKTTTFTAANGEGYFVNTTGGAVTVNLPAGSVGAIVSIKDYAQTFQTNNCTISANGSENIEGITDDLILDTKGIATTLVYGDATKGWQSVNSNEITNEVKFVAATGGTVLTCGNFKTHVFTGPGTFAVSCAGTASGSNTVEYAVVAGGGGGSFGGGGAGGFRQNFPSPTTAGLSITASSFPITVGGGGNGRPVTGTTTAGSNSIFSSITSAGGGRAGGVTSNGGDGGDGGSGGGAGHGTSNTGAKDDGGSGNVPSVSPAQGFDGGNGFQTGCYYGGGGGGGAAAVGTGAVGTNPNVAYTGGNGGIGVPIADSNFGPTAPSYGTPGPAPGRYFAGGGGGSYYYNPGYGFGGAGGGGRSGVCGGGPGCGSVAGTTNTGGGGGGANGQGKNGGSGIVIIRYKFQ